MARYWTWSEIRTKVEADLGLEDEDFVTPDELLTYANEAIDEAESEIHTLYEDYFLSRALITLVNGTDGYALPSDIYAHKIRKLVYRRGTTVNRIDRLKERNKLERYIENLALPPVTDGSYDGYLLLNGEAGEPQIVLSPPVGESGELITVFYLRNANRLVEDDDICDIPEFASFVIQSIKVRCYEKEGHPNLTKAIYDLESQRSQMTDTLTAMVPDADNEIEADLSSYEEQS